MCILVVFIESLFLRFKFDGSFDQNYIELLIVVDSILTCHFIFLEIMEVKKNNWNCYNLKTKELLGIWVKVFELINLRSKTIEAKSKAVIK